MPVGKHYVSPWELVEGQKGGCNVAPWQELGAIKYDRQLDKMEVNFVTRKQMVLVQAIICVISP